MKIKITEAERLAKTSLQTLGYSSDNADIITRHLIDCELRGYAAAGLARILSIRDRLGQGNPPKETIEVTRSSPATAQIDGHDTLGYLVAQRATEEAIQKAKQTGVAVVGANATWYTGMLAYYAEQAAKEDLVTVIASNTSPWVAPHGGFKPMFGTNPFAIGFPSGGEVPVIYDIGTSKLLHADLLLARRLGKDLPPDGAFSEAGEMTQNPWEALNGAIAVWGGHRGSGLAIAVQLLGVLAGSPAFPPDLKEFGFLIMTIDPAAFRPIEDFKAEVETYSTKMKESPSLQGGDAALRMPFERSAAARKQGLEAGEFEVDEQVVKLLQGLQ